MAQDSIGYNRLLAIGGSAGSLEVVMKIVTLLPPRVAAAVILILHRKNASDSILPGIIASKTSWRVKEVEDKDALNNGTIYLAPPDYHLLLEDTNSFSLDASEKVHYSRPSIDVTFEQVAEVYGASAIGVLLSGANADGAAGLLKIKKQGGFTIVQEPASAEVGYMPQQAIDLNAAHAIISGNELPRYIQQLLLQS